LTATLFLAIISGDALCYGLFVLGFAVLALLMLFLVVAACCFEGSSAELIAKANAIAADNLPERLGSVGFVFVDVAGAIMDMRYASTDNFTGKQIYQSAACIMHADAARGLELAAAVATAMGYGLKIFDTFRPMEAQVALFNAVPDPAFVSDPNSGPRNHCRGMAIDLTLVDLHSGAELDCGTGYDAMVAASSPSSAEVTPEQKNNRALLAGIMSVGGFIVHPREWWHFDFAATAVNNPSYNAQYPVRYDRRLRTGIMLR
jgi:D-alanyl-D-alanine dipeptidase